jgi:hypothetical protein
VNVAFNNTNEKTKSLADAQTFNTWVGESHAFIVLEPLKEDFSEQNVFITQVRDQGTAAQALRTMATGAAVDTFHDRPVYQLKNSEAINRVFGNNFVLFSNSFGALNGDVAVFANSEDVLKLVIEKMNRGECLNKDAKFQKAIENHPASVNSFVYVNPKRADLMFDGLTKENSAVRNYLRMFSSIIINTSVHGDWVNSSVVLKTEGEEQQNGGILWKTRLQTLSTYIPQIVWNVNTGEKEIFTQDTSGNIYLISKAGEILFTKNIGEQIVSGVYQLDYYNNGKLQYVFNTAHHIFIVDRFGNYVGSFPLRLSYPATAGMTFVADSMAKTYHYYIPCSNGGVYGYEANGKPLSGWSPKAGVGLLDKPMQYLRAKNMGLFVAYNTSGRLMLYDTKGALKWSVNELPQMPQNFSIISTDSDLVLLNASGKQLIEVSADGNDQIKPLIDSAYSFAASRTSDSTYLYYFSNHSQVRAYDEKGTFKNAIQLSGSSISQLEIVLVGDKKYLLVRDDSAPKILLYDLDMKNSTDFSIKNTSSYFIGDLFDNKRPVIISSDSTGAILCSRL